MATVSERTFETVRPDGNRVVIRVSLGVSAQGSPTYSLAYRKAAGSAEADFDEIKLPPSRIRTGDELVRRDGSTVRVNRVRADAKQKVVVLSLAFGRKATLPESRDVTVRRPASAWSFFAAGSPDPDEPVRVWAERALKKLDAPSNIYDWIEETVARVASLDTVSRSFFTASLPYLRHRDPGKSFGPIEVGADRKLRTHSGALAVFRSKEDAIVALKHFVTGDSGSSANVLLRAPAEAFFVVEKDPDYGWRIDQEATAEFKAGA